MALAGYGLVGYAKASSGSVSGSDELDGIKSLDFGPTLTLQDITNFKSTGNARAVLATLRGGTINMGGDLIMSDAPQGVIRTAATDGSSVWISIEFDPSGSSGSKGFKVECKVADYKITGAVEGVIQFSAFLTFTAAPTTI